jgi:hypothetical protein
VSSGNAELVEKESFEGLVKNSVSYSDLAGQDGQLGLESGVEAEPGFIERFRKDSGFPDDGHEIGVGEPAGKGVHMNMSGDSGARGLPNVHSEIDALRIVEITKDAFGFLTEGHHLLRGMRGQLLQLV